MKNKSPIHRYRRINYGYKSAQPWKIPNKSLIPSDIDIAKRYARVGGKIFDLCYFNEMGSNVPDNIPQKVIVVNVFFTSLNELNKMVRRRLFYSCNAKLFKYYMSDICEKVSLGQNLHSGLASDFLFNSIYLLFEHKIIFNTSVAEYGVSKSHQTPFYKLYWSSRSIAWQGKSDDSYIAIASLRLSIENRIRSAFGIYGSYNRITSETRPISMFCILKAIKRFSDSIEINPSVDEIIRIYNWSNIYIHAAYGTYPWLVLYAHEVLKPIFEMGSHNGHINPSYSIKASRNTIKNIRELSMSAISKSGDWIIDGPEIDECRIAII